MFLQTMKELPATLLLRPVGFDTLAIRVWLEASEEYYQLAAPAALLIVFLSLPALMLLVAKTGVGMNRRLVRDSVNGSDTDEQQDKNEDGALATAEPIQGGSAVLDLHDVSCAYEPTRPAVEDISFSVRQGEILCLLGPSGCGKTTILRAIAGFERVINGTITLSGHLVSSPDRLVPTEQRHIGMVFQEYALFPHLRVEKNIAFGLNHLPRPQQRTIVDDLLTLTGLRGLEHRYPPGSPEATTTGGVGPCTRSASGAPAAG